MGSRGKGEYGHENALFHQTRVFHNSRRGHLLMFYMLVLPKAIDWVMSSNGIRWCYALLILSQFQQPHLQLQHLNQMTGR